MKLLNGLVVAALCIGPAVAGSAQTAPAAAPPAPAGLPAAAGSGGGGGGFGWSTADAAVQKRLAEKRRAEATTYINVVGKMEPAAYIGVSTSPVPAALSEQLKLPRGVGLTVDFVEPKGPAEEAQIKQYDVLQKLDDQLLINAHQFAVLVRTHKGGDEVTLTVIHRGESKQVKVKLVEREVMALDAENPWGSPPVPLRAGGGYNIVSFQPQGGGMSVGGDVRISTIQQQMTDLNEHGEMRWTDDQGVLILQHDGPGRKLIVANKDGKWLSSYEVEDESKLKAVPDDVRTRYERMLKVQPKAGQFFGNFRRFNLDPATQPARAVPGFGESGSVEYRVAPQPAPEGPRKN